VLPVSLCVVFFVLFVLKKNKTKIQHREILATLDTQDTGEKQKKQK
jgi:hypothetical protein